MPCPYPEEPVITAVDARVQLQRLCVERLHAVGLGPGANAVDIAALETDIACSRSAYIGLAVTEIATLRAELSGAQVG